MGKYEEKAKAYDKAVEQIKTLLGKEGTVIGRYWLEKIFPELAESEDERIRKMLISLVKHHADTLERQYEEDMLVYLERQKERQPVEIHIDNPNIQKFDSDVKVTTSDSSADGKELLYVSNKSYDIGFRDGVASVKPAEWSEEDERKRNGLIKGLEDRMGFGWASDPFSREEYISWLKSLRPQPHWKPSEEQMKHLERCFTHGHIFQLPNQHVLESLYNDLKKL